MIIRKFDISEADEVVGIWDKCGLLHPPNDPYQEIRNKIAFQPELFIVGEVDDKIMATMMIGYEGRRGWLNLLAVLPEYQGRGYGRQLVQYAMETLKNLGAPKINLLVRPTNSKVRTFYEKQGFQFEDAILMSHRFTKEK